MTPGSKGSPFGAVSLSLTTVLRKALLDGALEGGQFLDCVGRRFDNGSIEASTRAGVVSVVKLCRAVFIVVIICPQVAKCCQVCASAALAAFCKRSPTLFQVSSLKFPLSGNCGLFLWIHFNKLTCCVVVAFLFCFFKRSRNNKKSRFCIADICPHMVPSSLPVRRWLELRCLGLFSAALPGCLSSAGLCHQLGSNPAFSFQTPCPCLGAICGIWRHRLHLWCKWDKVYFAGSVLSIFTQTLVPLGTFPSQ